MMSLKYIYMMFFLMYLLNLFFLIMNFKEILSTLIMIEFLALNLFFFFFVLTIFENSMSFILYFLIILVCEGSMGLSIFITMIRLGGNSNFSSSNFSMC